MTKRKLKHLKGPYPGRVPKRYLGRFTVAQVAKGVGVSPTYIHSLVTGGGNPSVHLLRKVSRFTGEPLETVCAWFPGRTKKAKPARTPATPPQAVVVAADHAEPDDFVIHLLDDDVDAAN